MENAIPLSGTEVGGRYMVTELPAEKRLRMRLMTLGLLERSVVKITCRYGNYLIVRIFDSTNIGLDGNVAAEIKVEPR